MRQILQGFGVILFSFCCVWENGRFDMVQKSDSLLYSLRVCQITNLFNCRDRRVMNHPSKKLRPINRAYRTAKSPIYRTTLFSPAIHRRATMTSKGHQTVKMVLS